MNVAGLSVERFSNNEIQKVVGDSIASRAEFFHATSESSGHFGSGACAVIRFKAHVIGAAGTNHLAIEDIATRETNLRLREVGIKRYVLLECWRRTGCFNSNG